MRGEPTKSEEHRFSPSTLNANGQTIARPGTAVSNGLFNLELMMP